MFTKICFKLNTRSYAKLLDEHGRLLTRDGHDSQDIVFLRTQIDDMRSHLSTSMKSMELRLIQLQQENSALEKTIHDMNASKMVEARETHKKVNKTVKKDSPRWN